MSITVMHAADSRIPRRRSVCSHLVRTQTVNKQTTTTTTTEQNHVPPSSRSKRRNKKPEEEKQSENKEVDRAREETRINIRASFQRWRSCGSVRTFLLDR